MKPEVRILVGAFVRLVLLFFAGWFALAEDALGEGASMVSRFGLAFLFLVASILVGELATLRSHFGLLVGALRAAGGTAGAAGVTTAVAQAIAGEPVPPPDPRASVDILIRALGTEDEDTRAKAHAHLRRLTGQNLPPQQAAWDAWWKAHRDDFQGPQGGS